MIYFNSLNNRKKERNRLKTALFVSVSFLLFFISNTVVHTSILPVDGYTRSYTRTFGKLNMNVVTGSLRCKRYIDGASMSFTTQIQQRLLSRQSIRSQIFALGRQRMSSSLKCFSTNYKSVLPVKIHKKSMAPSSIYLSSLGTYESTETMFDQSSHQSLPFTKNAHFDRNDTPSANARPFFSFQLPEGRCVGVILNIDHQGDNFTGVDNDNQLFNLHLDEIAYAKSLKAQKDSFVVGRLALRSALRRVVADEHKQEHITTSSQRYHETIDFINENSILKDKHGRPSIPLGYLGSISHKQNKGVALVDIDNSYKDRNRNYGTEDEYVQNKGIGVDIERTCTKHVNIARRVLTERESKTLGKVKGVSREEEVLLRFSLKESLYKAMHPLICQRVGFLEAEVTPHSNGTASIWFNLESGAHDEFDHSKTTAHWRRVEDIQEDYFVTSASVTRKGV